MKRPDRIALPVSATCSSDTVHTLEYFEMNYWMILKISLKALSRNKIRSALTMLGIIIGIAAVIAMVSLGQGAQRQIQEEIASLGDNTVWVRAGSRRSWGVRSASGTMNNLKATDFEAMLNECPAVKAVSPSSRSMAQVVFGNQNWNTRIEGYNELYPEMRKLDYFPGQLLRRKSSQGSRPGGRAGQHRLDGTVLRQRSGRTNHPGQEPVFSGGRSVQGKGIQLLGPRSG